MKKACAIALLVVAGGVVAWLVSRMLMTEEQRVARTVRKLVDAIEDGSAGSVGLFLTRDYKDCHGNDRLEVKKMLTLGFHVFESVSVRIENMQIEIEEGEEKTATVEFDATLSATSKKYSDLPPWRGLVRLRMRKADDEWLIFHAEYPLPEGVRY